MQASAGLSSNGTASGDSGLKTAGLPPLAVPISTVNDGLWLTGHGTGCRVRGAVWRSYKRQLNADGVLAVLYGGAKDTNSGYAQLTLLLLLARTRGVRRARRVIHFGAVDER